MTDRVAFSIGVEGTQRELFSVLQRTSGASSGDLLLLIKRAHHIQETVGFQDQQVIDEQRYSIHVSPNSPSYNTIKHTLKVGSQLRNTGAWTDAIKSRSGYVFLFAKRSPSLEIERYILRPKRNMQVESLGEYDPKKFTLFYAVYVSAPDRSTAWYHTYNVGVIEHVFAQFRISVLWQFLSLPSDSTGRLSHTDALVHPDVVKAEPDLAFLSRLSRGILERECIDFFSGACENLRSQFIQSLSRQFITSSEGECFSIEQLACLGQFFRWPLYSTPEMREHMARYRLAEAVGFLPYPWPELTQEYAAIAFRSMYENFPYPR